MECTGVDRESERRSCLLCGGEAFELTRSSRMLTGKSNMHILTGWARALCRLNRDLVSMLQSERSAPTEENFFKKRELPTTDSAFRWRLGGFTEIEEEPLHVVPPPSRFQQLHSLPLPRLVFPLPLRLLCSLARKRLNCQQLLSGLGVFWRCFPTAQLLCHSRRMLPSSNAQAKGRSCHKKKWGRAAARSFCCCSNLIKGGGPTLFCSFSSRLSGWAH